MDSATDLAADPAADFAEVRAPWTTVRAGIAVGCLALVGCAGPSRLADYLTDTSARYHAGKAMVASAWAGPSYHTRMARGSLVHETVDSLDYAQALLARGRPSDQERASAILRKVLTLQETDPGNEYYGIWPWFLEEPIAAMSPPDRNWADFCAARLAQILVDHETTLEPALCAAVKRSLGHAARAIRARDVDPAYTNIAIMGSGVAVAAGELLDEPGLVVYGRTKLKEVVELTRRHTNLREYNSPDYTLLALLECERTLDLVSDPPTRRAAEDLRRTAWRTIAESFHPETQQWAGPHSRAYSDRLTASQIDLLSSRLDTPLAVHPAERDDGVGDPLLTPPLPCPSDLQARFAEGSKRELRRTFFRGKDPESSVIGTTWIVADVSLGSINRACLWQQRRPLIAYWRTPDDPAVVLRLRALKQGEDFAALGVQNHQTGPRVTSTFYTLRDRGDHHRHLDPQKDSTYLASDLRLRYELRGRGVSAQRLAANRFALSAGGHRAVLHMTPGSFFGAPVAFESGQDGETAFVDVVLYRGPERAFDLRTAPPMTPRVDLVLESF